jgi:hypothetical protein
VTVIRHDLDVDLSAAKNGVFCPVGAGGVALVTEHPVVAVSESAQGRRV